MPSALRRPEPVTIEAFDAFVEARADTALFELVEGVLKRSGDILHLEAVEFRIDLTRICFDVEL